MLWQIVKKQGLTLVRNRRHLFLLLVLPIILISILSAALGGFMSGEAMTIDVKVAMIEHEDEVTQIEKFNTELQNYQLPKEQVKALTAGSTQFAPVQLFKDEMSQQLAEYIQLEMITKEEKASVLNDKSYAALIEIPKGFTYDALHHVFLEKDNISSLQLYLNEEKEIGSQIIKEMVEQFHEQLSFITFAGKHGIDPDHFVVNLEETVAQVEHTNDIKATTSQEYYTVAMVVMNVLFIASTIGSYAFQEKKTNVFNRIIISNVSRWTYFLGVFISTVIFAFIQTMIIFGVAWVLFEVVWENILGLFLVTIGFSIAIGGVAVLLTAISYRLDSEVFINFFQMIIVTALAFLGGSFTPIGDFSEVVRTIGNLTPNGASMSAYLSILRGHELSAVMGYLGYLVIFAVILLLLAVISFPKRGQMA